MLLTTKEQSQPLKAKPWWWNLVTKQLHVMAFNCICPRKVDSLCAAWGCDQQNEELCFALAYHDVWGWSASQQLWNACSAWWATNWIPRKEGSQLGLMEHTLTWCLRYSYQSLPGGPWGAACLIRTLWGSPYQILFLQVNYFGGFAEPQNTLGVGEGKHGWNMIPNLKLGT